LEHQAVKPRSSAELLRTIATMQKFRPRTKNINNKCWHFMEHVEKGYIVIDALKSKDQLADILTKPRRDMIIQRVSSSNTSAFQGSVIYSEELNVGNAESAVEMSALRENVLRTRLYEISKMDAALHNAVDDRDGAAIPVKSSKAGKS